MFMPCFGVNTEGRPDACVSRSNTVMRSRMPPENSLMTSETFVVSINWPRSMARKTRTFVIALVAEKMLNTESRLSGFVPGPPSSPIAVSSPTLPPRATLMTAPK